jgi:hypothetical protein
MKRNEAIELGLKTYEPEKPCKRGHRERYTATGTCAPCGREATANNNERLRLARVRREISIAKGRLPLVVEAYGEDHDTIRRYVEALNLARSMTPGAIQPLHIGGVTIQPGAGRNAPDER